MKRLHPLGVLLATARVAGLPAAVFGTLAVLQGDIDRFLGLVLTMVVGALAWGITDWWRFQYRVDEDGLVIERGVLTLERRVVPRQRIRGIDVSAPLAHRLLGLRRITVDAAAEGGDGSEMSLAAVTVAEADALRRELLGGESETEEKPLATASAATLALAGATGPRWLAVPFGIVGAGAGLILGADSGVWQQIWDRISGGEGVSGLQEIPVLTVVGLAAASLLVVVAIAAAASVLSDGGFRLTDPEGRFVTERGLVRRRQVAIDRGRVVAVSMREPLSWRPFRLAGVRARITGVGADSGAGAGRTQLLPAGGVGSAQDLVGGIVPFDPQRMVAHPRRALSRRLMRATALPVVAVAVLLALGEPLFAGLAVVVVLTAAAVGFDRWQALASGVDGRRLKVREGSVTRRTSVLSPDAAVTYRISSSPFQRRSDLCVLEAKMGRGAGSVRALDVDPRRAADIAGELDPPLLNTFFTD